MDRLKAKCDAAAATMQGAPLKWIPVQVGSQKHLSFATALTPNLVRSWYGHAASYQPTYAGVNRDYAFELTLLRRHMGAPRHLFLFLVRNYILPAMAAHTLEQVGLFTLE